MDLVTASKNGVEIYRCVEQALTLKKTLPAVTSRDAVGFSPSGAHLGLINNGALEIYSCGDADYQVVLTIPPTLPQTGGIRNFYFSPLCTFVVTFERYDKEANAENAHIYDLKTGECVRKYFLKKMTVSSWPVMKWSSDESTVCRMVSNVVEIMDGKTLEPRAKLHCKGVSAFELAPGGGSPNIAVFVPETKGQPAKCLIFELDSLENHKAGKTFYKAQDVQLLWNLDGSALLVLTHEDVDDSGKTYYGNTNLYFIRTDGSLTQIVASWSEGAVHDVQWNPRKNEFLVLHGDLPCSMKLYDGVKCLQRLDMGKGRMNTIKWAPSFGRLFLIAGFGNLAGKMDFWDHQGQGSAKNIGETKFECCVIASWAPNDRLLLCATTSPRMRVDNCIQIMDYTGDRLGEKVEFDELLTAAWRPMPNAFKERPPSPERISGAQKRETAVPKVQAYRPPGGAGRGAGSVAAMMRSERGEDQIGQATATKISGAPHESQAPSRNQRRKQAKEAAEKAAEEAAAKAAEEAKARAEKSVEDLTPEEKEKRIRAIKKKLRAMDTIRDKPVDQLDAAQKAKLDGEPALLKELAKLEA